MYLAASILNIVDKYYKTNMILFCSFMRHLYSILIFQLSLDSYKCLFFYFNQASNCKPISNKVRRYCSHDRKRIEGVGKIL